MAIPFINSIITQANTIAFKKSVDDAKAIITPIVPVITGAEKKGLKGVQRERYEFLTASYTVADKDPTLMPSNYNHANHKMSNDLLFAIDDLQSYAEGLIKDLTTLREVVASQSLAEGQQVLAQAEAKSKSDASYKPIWKALSLLFRRKAAPKAVVPTP